METTPPNIVILKRPNNVKNVEQNSNLIKIHPIAKTFEEKQADYEAARRRILGSDTEDRELSNVLEEPSEDENINNESNSPKKYKSREITPLLSIEFKPATETSLEAAIDNMLISEDGTRNKKNYLLKPETNSSFDLQPLVNNDSFLTTPMYQNTSMPVRHFTDVALPNKFYRQTVDASLIHPYANSSVNHVRSHHFPAYVLSQHNSHVRFPQNQAFSVPHGQVNFISPPQFPLNIPPPGYYNNRLPNQLMSQQQSNSIHSHRGSRNGKHNRRQMDMNFS